MNKLLSGIITTIFWRQYCDLEKKEKNRLTNNWFPKLKNMCELLFLEKEEKEEEFWNFYLKRSKLVNISLMLLLLLYNLSLSVCILGEPLAIFELPIDPLFKKYSVLILYMLPWAIFSTICMIFLLILHYHPLSFAANNVDVPSFWIGIGNSVFCCRIVILAMRLYRDGLDNFCSSAQQYNNEDDQTFIYFTLIMMIDTMAVTVFSVFPFPFHLILFLCTVEWFSQMERLHSCGPRMSYRPEFDFIPPLMAISITYLYAVLVVYALALEQSARRSFKNMRRQKRTLEEKRQIVHFLCFDTNHLLAVFQSAVSGLLKELRDATVGESLKGRIDRSVEVASAAVNEMIRIVRVEEDMNRSTLLLRPQQMSRSNHVNLLHFINTVKQNLSLGGSEDFRIALDKVSITVVDDISISVQPDYLEILSRRLLAFAAEQVVVQEVDNPQQPTVSLSMKILDSTEAKTLIGTYDKSFHTDSSHYLHFSLSWTSCSGFTLFSSRRSRELDRFILTCLRVVEISRGLFWKTSGEILCLFPCLNMSMQREEPDIPSSEGWNLENRFTRFCLLVDGVCREEVRSIIEKVSNECDFVIHEVKAIGNLEGTDLVFVDALSKCRELGSLNFEGLVVLVSGFHSLVGDTGDLLFHYSLPIPCLDEDIKRFKAWLPTKSSATLLHQDSIRSDIVDTQFYTRFYIIISKWWRRITSFGMKPLSLERREAYLRWRTFSPISLDWHHTKQPDLCIIGLMISTVGIFFYGAPEPITDPVIRLLTLLFFGFVFRHWIFQYFLEPAEIPISTITKIAVLVFILVNRIYRILLCTTTEASLIKLSQLQFTFNFLSDMTVDQLLNQKIGSISFLESVSGAIRLLGISKIILYPFPWPTIPIMAVLSSIPVIIFLLSLPRNILTYQILACVFVFQFFNLVLELLLLYNFEIVHRQEFSILCDNILSDEIIRGTASLSQPMIRRALGDMNTARVELMAIFTPILQKDSLMLLGDLFLTSLHAVKQSGLLMTELKNVLQINQTMLEGNLYSPSKDKYYLRRVLEDLIHSLTGKQRYVRARYDSRLSVVRFDREHFITLLTNCLLVAHKRLRRSSLCPEDVDYQKKHDIFVDIKLLEREGVTHRFADIRSMIVVVVDTGDIEDSSTNPSSSVADKDTRKSVLEELEIGEITGSFSERVCERFATGLEDHALYETGTLEHDRYTHFTRFSFPYQLTLDSHVASEAVRDGEDTEVYVGEIKTDALLTKLQKMESLARCLKLKRRQGRLKSLTMKTWRELKEQGICCTMLIVSTIRQDQYLEPLVDALQRYGWVCLFTYPYSGDQTIKLSDEQQCEVDCIMLDRCAEYEDNMNFNDLIIGVRAQGYRNLIIDLTSSWSEMPQAGSQQQQSLEGVDLQVTAPLSMESGVCIFKKYENKLRNLLLGFDEC